MSFVWFSVSQKKICKKRHFSIKEQNEDRRFKDPTNPKWSGKYNLNSFWSSKDCRFIWSIYKNWYRDLTLFVLFFLNVLHVERRWAMCVIEATSDGFRYNLQISETIEFDIVHTLSKSWKYSLEVTCCAGVLLISKNFKK